MHRKLALPVVGALALLSAGAFLALGSARGPEVQSPKATRTATFALG